ncbi:hypothetical+protein [Methylocapsa aurea]|uniref:substrate-binding domain-containing protein n=1 Tax=Methylocapsa aurea TaxID=663610 RepID=UPI003D1894E9
MPIVVLIALFLATVSPAHAEDIRILAAGSLKGPLTAIAKEYEKTHTAHVALVFGPAGALRDRIIGGEAFDLYATAAFPQAQTLTERGLARDSVLLARNKLCALVPDGSPIASDSLVAALLKPETRPGTSTPNTDPAGDYTWAFFQRIDQDHPGAFAALTAKARMLFGGAKRGDASTEKAPAPLTRALDDQIVDLLILYCSGAMSTAERSAGKYRAFELPPPYAIEAEYGLTLSTRASSSAIDFFIAMLSPDGQTTLRRFGFTPIAEPIAKK